VEQEISKRMKMIPHLSSLLDIKRSTVEIAARFVQKLCLCCFIPFLAVSLFLPNVSSASDETFVRVISNDKDLQSCLVGLFKERLGGAVTVSNDLFSTTDSPYAEVVVLCDAHEPMIVDRTGRPIGTQALTACASTLEVFPGRKFVAAVPDETKPSVDVSRLSQRLALRSTVGQITPMCKQIAVDLGRQLYDWLLRVR
jgi:hypothetical protein